MIQSPKIISYVMRCASCALIVLICALAFGAPARAQQTMTVDNTTDDGSLSACTAAPNDCSLRGAVAKATGRSGDDAIEFDATVFGTPRTITLSGTELRITPSAFFMSLTINGRGVVTVSGANASRVFYIDAGVNAKLNGLTIRNGKGDFTYGGGGIFNLGNLEVTDSVISGNAARVGGGVANSGYLKLTNTTISDNTADSGGGIVNSGSADILNSTISGNNATPGLGGGINNDRQMTVTNTTISGNKAAAGGGGIISYGSSSNFGGMTVTNSTIVNNVVTEAFLTPPTVGYAGGISNYGWLRLRSSIIANNSARIEPDLSLTTCGRSCNTVFHFESSGYNLVEDLDPILLGYFTATDLTGIDPKLGPLQNNGGRTFTHAPLAGSPVIDKGKSFGSVTDQRGAARPYDSLNVPNAEGGDGSDIGAFETLAPLGRPLVFIPGIAGSRLVRASDGSERWPGLLTFHDGLTLDPTDPARIADIVPGGPVRSVSAFGRTVQIYGPLLDRLTSAGYRTDGSSPTLYVFDYDWRKSNAENADALGRFIEGIRNSHFGSDVDIVAHSMGGLLAQRYILNHPGGAHHVAKLVTIGTPWLGAPKLVNTLETGEFFDGLESLIVRQSTLKKLVEFFPGAHELMPSPLYFELGGTPFGENGWDINGDGASKQTYTFTKMSQLINQRHPRSTPAANALRFHDVAGQDGWRDRMDGTGVQYFHFYGEKSGADTVGEVVATRRMFCTIGGLCVPLDSLDVVPTRGDGTVPLISAGRIGNGINLNAAGATVRLFPYTTNPNGDVDHLGLVRNVNVQAAVIDALNSPPAASTGEPAVPGADVSTSTDTEEVAAQPHYYVKLQGAGAVTLTDSGGIALTPFADDPNAGMPGVSVYVTGDKSMLAILPRTDTYEFVLTVGNMPVALEVRTGTDIETSQAVRYVDLNLPAGTKVKIQTTPQGIGILRYDSDGDGTYETPVTPTASVTGAAAQDTEAPSVTVSSTAQGGNSLITITSADAGSGVAETRFSLNGTDFQTYAGPFTVNRYQAPAVYAFADDKAGNRSGLSTFRLVDAGVPVLITQADSVRAVALDSVLRLPEPFQLNYERSWGSDRRTRLMLFASNFELSPEEGVSAVTASAEDASGKKYQLGVEYVGKVPGSPWLTCVVVRLSDDLTGVGDVWVQISVKGVTSNRVQLGIGHIGGGPTGAP
jgi:pimeloyl-ACP methyl ester carboxylesterase